MGSEYIAVQKNWKTTTRCAAMRKQTRRRCHAIIRAVLDHVLIPRRDVVHALAIGPHLRSQRAAERSGSGAPDSTATPRADALQDHAVAAPVR